MRYILAFFVVVANLSFATVQVSSSTLGSKFNPVANGYVFGASALRTNMVALQYNTAGNKVARFNPISNSSTQEALNKSDKATVKAVDPTNNIFTMSHDSSRSITVSTAGCSPGNKKAVVTGTALPSGATMSYTRECQSAVGGVISYFSVSITTSCSFVPSPTPCADSDNGLFVAMNISGSQDARYY